MPGTTCAFRGCHSKEGQGISMFSFPKDPESCRLWIEACYRKDLLSKEFSCKNYYKLCELHFEEKYISKGSTKKYLLPNSHPTIFPKKQDLELDTILKLPSETPKEAINLSVITIAEGKPATEPRIKQLSLDAHVSCPSEKIKGGNMDDLAPPLNPEDDLFSFETDHLALRGNEDYCEVLKTLVILSAQRERAHKDFKIVSEMRSGALNDPFGTLEKIKNGSDLGIPPLMELPKLPKIDFQKYKVKVPESDLMEIYSEGKEPVEVKAEIKHLKSSNNDNTWSPEEQKRLEELLQIYPPEPVEMRRFHKIAQALGNRTVHQVASRVQKYFLKLLKAGLPIPGRIPKAAERYRRQKLLHKHQRHNHYLWKPTTFFPELSVPVQMDDLNSIPGPSEAPSLNPTDNYLIRSDYQQSTKAAPESTETIQESQLKLLKRVREVKLREQSESYISFTHSGYKCDYCDETPIVGTRWHCTICPGSVDYCTDCVISQMYSESPHPLHHWLSLYEDESESASLLQGFSEPCQEFDKQIAEELRSKQFEAEDDNDEDSSE